MEYNVKSYNSVLVGLPYLNTRAGYTGYLGGEEACSAVNEERYPSVPDTISKRSTSDVTFDVRDRVRTPAQIAARNAKLEADRRRPGTGAYAAAAAKAARASLIV